MLRSVLIPYHATYFLGNTGAQSKEVYSKIEKLAKKEIDSFVGSTDFFLILYAFRSSRTITALP